MQFRPTRAVINLEYLSHNVRELRRAVGSQVFFCPMVKANAYGHGSIEISKRLEREKVQHLGVALIEEGIFLRESGVQVEILFFGTCDEKGARAVIAHRLTPVLSTWDQLRALESVAPAGYPVHVKFDMGMRRLGFSLADTSKLVAHFSTQSHLKVRGILTHLHSGEDAFDLVGTSFEQLKKFQEVENSFKVFQPISHTLNSSGLINFLKHKGKDLPQGISPQQGVRPGLSIYGPMPVSTDQLQLKPVMSLRSETAKYTYVQKGEGVSYNHTWKAEQDSVTAVVPIGYADGYHRILSNRAEVLFRGKRVPLVGNVCMDYLIIDITKTLRNDETVDGLKSEAVTLFGEDQNQNQISAFELAQKAQTITWEILTSVSGRVPREVIS